MQNQKDHLSPTYSIIGMDLFVNECSDLKSFKTLLLTGAYRNNGVNHEPEFISQSLQDMGIKKSTYHDLTIFERLLLLVSKRALIDADLDHDQTDDVSGSFVVHFPDSEFSESSTIDQFSSELSPGKISKPIFPSLTLEQPVVIRENFEDALGQSFTHLQKPLCDIIALISFFEYSNPELANSDRGLVKPAGDFRSKFSKGLGCVVLSNQNQIKKPYADLIWQESQVDAEKSKEKNQCSEYPHFQFAPVIRMIQSALSLNSKTHFPYPEPSLKDKEVAGEEHHSFIRPWFELPFTEKRLSTPRLQERKINNSSIQLEKGYLSRHHPDQPFSNFGLYLLPINFDDPQQSIQKIDEIKNRIVDCQNIESFIDESLAEYKNHKPGIYTLIVLGSSKQEIFNELEHARIGVSKSFIDGNDWQTPVGSYFTPNPFGPEEKIAFVYPGAFGTYVGMGREVFYLFPQLHNALYTLTSDPGNIINENSIFPQKNTLSVREHLQKMLNNNPTQMISSGVCFSYLYTVILRDIFNVKPDAAFGYSLGEISMMFAMGIWTQADAIRTSMEASPIFHERVSGPQTAIRDFWKLHENNGETINPPIWANYVLMASYEKAQESVKNEDRVYITHINTPRQVVIGGDVKACQRVVAALKCMYLQAPYHHAIHCEPVASEFNAFMHLNNWPVENKPDIPIYTAADYATFQYKSESIKRSFAKMLTNPIDFPRLINLAYEGGTRIFIELGAGSNCSKWVAATLKGKPHLSISINQSNVDDHVSILRLLARLVSHQVPVDLQVLKGNSNG